MSAIPADPKRGTVVVGVDGSPASKDALRWAANYARQAGAALEVVSAWHWPVSMVVSLPVPQGFDPVAEAETSLQSILAEVLGDDPGLAVTTRVEGRPAAAVLIDASAGALLLVVGSRGHGGFSGLLLGSVSEQCTRYAACPVVVVRHHGAHEKHS
jgi:nucleotide-binding universal stress UspA family protein